MRVDRGDCDIDDLDRSSEPFVQKHFKDARETECRLRITHGGGFPKYENTASARGFRHFDAHGLRRARESWRKITTGEVLVLNIGVARFEKKGGLIPIAENSQTKF